MHIIIRFNDNYKIPMHYISDIAEWQFTLTQFVMSACMGLPRKQTESKNDTEEPQLNLIKFQ